MAARLNEAKRRRRSVVRLIHPTVEIVPVSIDAGARGISRRSRLLGYLDGPASRASHLTADRASRGLLNGFPGLLAGWSAAAWAWGPSTTLGQVAAGLV